MNGLLRAMASSMIGIWLSVTPLAFAADAPKDCKNPFSACAEELVEYKFTKDKTRL